MPDELRIEPKPAPAAAAPAEPAEPIGPTAEELAAQVEAAEKAKAEAEARAQAAQDSYTQLAISAMQGFDPAPATTTPAATTEALPDPEEDPRGYAEAVAKREAAAVRQELTEQYRQAEAQRTASEGATTFQTAIEVQKMTMRADPANYPDFDNPEVTEELNKLVAQGDVRQLAQPGALATLYYHVMGRRAASAAATETRRATSPQGGRSTAVEPHEPAPKAPQLSDAETRAAARAGMTPEEWVAYKGAGIMTEKEYLATKQGA